MDNLNLRAVFNECVGIVIAYDDADDTERRGARLSECRWVGDLHPRDISMPSDGGPDDMELIGRERIAARKYERFQWRHRHRDSAHRRIARCDRINCADRGSDAERNKPGDEDRAAA
jgi:hypothetical protein